MSSTRHFFYGQNLASLWNYETLNAGTLFLIIYANFCFVRCLLAVATYTFPGLSVGGRVVDSAYWVVDWGAGTLLLALVALLSLGGIVERIQVRSCLGNILGSFPPHLSGMQDNQVRGCQFRTVMFVAVQ